MFIGGEFYDDPTWQLHQPASPAEGALFLNGGRACLALIAVCLLTRNIRRVLLPSYLCPVILDVLERKGISRAFYHVNKNLSIDLDDLQIQARGMQAIYFINYFGLPPSGPELTLLRQLQRNGALLIEDSAMAAFVRCGFADFTFNSLRKQVAHDGGYLFSRFPLDGLLAPYRGLPNTRLPLMRAYRRELRTYLFDGQGSHRRLTALLARAERAYDHEVVVAGDPGEQQAIELLDWPGMAQARRENYLYLLNRITAIPQLEPVFAGLPPGAVPLGLPVYVRGADRDRLYDWLGRNGVGLSLHWAALTSDPRTRANNETAAMAAGMLTLCCDQRFGKAELDFEAEMLQAGLAALVNN